MSLLLIDRTVAGDYSEEEARVISGKVKHYQKHKCFYCSRQMVKNRLAKSVAPEFPTKDHFLPKKRGFKKVAGNVVIACHDCNTRAQHGLPTFSEILRMIKMYQDLNLPCVFKFVEKQGVTLEDMMEKVV